MGRACNININCLEEVDSNPYGFKSKVEEVTADMVETARELGLEVKPDSVTQSHIKLERMSSCFLRMSKKVVS